MDTGVIMTKGGTILKGKNFLKSAAILIHSRAEAIIIWSWNASIACFIVSRGVPPVIPFILTLGGMMFLSLSVYIYNDCIDVEMDKLNSIKKNRPLPQQKVPESHGLILALIAGFSGLIILFGVNFYSFIFGSIYFLFFTVYSYPKIRLKKYFMVKEVILALGFPLTNLIGMYAVANSFVIDSFFAGSIIGMFAFAAMPAVADSTDIEEDRLAGGKTLAMVLSWKNKILLVIGGALAAFSCIVIAFFAFGFNILLPVLTIGVGMIFIWFMASLLHNFDSELAFKGRKIAGVYVIILQIAFVVGSLQIW